MEIRIFQRGFHYAQDGPGNRLVLHMQGCNLHCPWCSNPESMLMHPGSDYPFRSSCMDVEALYEEISSCQSLFFDGGGVTFTGGEPAMQIKALERLLCRLVENGYNTAIETNGTIEQLSSIFPLLSHLIMDVKHYDDQKFLAFTGGELDKVRRNLLVALQTHPDVLIRIPLIKEYNGTYEDIDGFLNFFKDLPTEKARFEFFRYHEYGRVKWEQLNMPYLVREGTIEREVLEAFEQAFREAGMTVVRT